MGDIVYKKSNQEIECIYYKNCKRTYSEHTHTMHIMLGTVEDGTICVVQNGVKEEVHSGEQFSILPNIPHEILPVTESYSMMVMCIKSDHIECEEYLYELWKKIIDQPENTFMIDEMAKSANVSKYHLIRIFKKAFGLTPHQFQIQCKVRKAQEVLERKGNIGEATFEAGFCDESHLDRCFQKVIGLSPKQYMDSVE